MNTLLSIQNSVNLFFDVLRITKNLFHTNRLVYKGTSTKGICILGTGPSFKTSLNEIQEMAKVNDVLAVNDFAISEDIFSSLQPHYYCLFDPGYWITTPTEEDLKNRRCLYESLLRNTKWEMTLIIPDTAYRTNFIQKTLEDNKNIKFIPISTGSIMSVDATRFINYCLRNNLILPAQNVLLSAILITINLGYKQIYLYGADHSWTEDLRVNHKNQVCTIRRHFYDDQINLIPWLTVRGESNRMSMIFSDLATIFKTHEVLANYAKCLSVNIINCSPVSYIDAYPRK